MNKERQSGFKIMLRLIKVLKPLAPIMMITISFGILGFLAATAITSFGMVAGADILCRYECLYCYKNSYSLCNT